MDTGSPRTESRAEVREAVSALGRALKRISLYRHARESHASYLLPALRPLQELLYKPSLSVAMTFSADPHLGMVASRFGGPAVVFLATTTFKLQSTASLR